MRIAFIGLGNMGHEMALRLVANGFDVAGYDSSEAGRAKFAAAGGTVVDRLAGLGGDRDVIITMLPDGGIVQAVLFGDQGLAQQLKPGAIVIEMSSSAPTDTIITAQRLAEKGVILIDAPVSGGVAGARDGRLNIMAGTADPAAFDKVKPVLDAMGNARLVGGTGAGHAAKAINNFVAAAAIAATAEGLVLAESFGLSPETMLDVINRSSGRSASSEGLFPAHVIPRTFSFGFAMSLMAKDAGIAARMSEDRQATLPFVALTSGQWAAARDALPGADFSAMQLYVEKQAGVE
ncbi:NAD(P)-dependent oxidoreductase [Sphingobium sp. DC-2]|uniref:NAD(P)-dependent oxidoreductase n=1 Tax=Sphingobium sp. DC-2 TaxID=1303256 RepID=UPI0004C32E37|nr:NAD(P)-dependent oxidoreductase [Sphingobium sp. DC-2]